MCILKRDSVIGKRGHCIPEKMRHNLPGLQVALTTDSPDLTSCPKSSADVQLTRASVSSVPEPPRFLKHSDIKDDVFFLQEMRLTMIPKLTSHAPYGNWMFARLLLEIKTVRFRQK